MINLIDLSSIICIIVSKINFIESSNGGYFLRMFRMFRSFYIMKLEYIIQRKTNEKYRVYSKSNKFYLVKRKGLMVGKFEWELKKCNLIQKIFYK